MLDEVSTRLAFVARERDTMLTQCWLASGELVFGASGAGEGR